MTNESEIKHNNKIVTPEYLEYLCSEYPRIAIDGINKAIKNKKIDRQFVYDTLVLD